MDYIEEQKQIQENLHHELAILLKTKSKQETLKFFNKYHEADIADALEELSKEERVIFFNVLDPEKAVDIVEELEFKQQAELIATLRTELAAKYIEEMEHDDRVDIIEELQDTHEDRVEKIIQALPEDEVSDIQDLLSYRDDSAGAIMTTDIISIPENLSVEAGIRLIKKQKPQDSESSFYIYIVDEENKLIGYTTLVNLIVSRSSSEIKSIRNDYPIKTHVTTDQEDVARLFQKYNLISLPVVDDDDHLIGLITVDDIVDVVIEEATEDFYKLSGTTDIDETQLLGSNIFTATLSRSPWLLVTIGGGFLASVIITKYSIAFQGSSIPLALILSFVPMLMGLGGNVGNQSATIMVRGLATGQIKNDHPIRYILKEMAIGLIIGTIIGSTTLLVNLFLLHLDFLFSVIVASALLANITAATLIGSALPILLKKLNIDPAIASAPFISTTLDIIGQIIYFSLTLKFLHLIQ